MQKILFTYMDEELAIMVTARLDGKKLVIEGNDFGKKVEEWWGERVYEYSMALPEKSVAHLSAVLRLSVNSKGELLETLAQEYNDNFCFSRLKNLFNQHGIEYKAECWS
ncbi:MAG: hypothetical protein ACM3VS_16060 [Candidatus Dadabacteria bacterium]